MLEKIFKEIRENIFVYIILLAILSVGFFLRVYNVNNLLGFYYDQGRDALVVWDLWKSGDIPFIGPTTGIAGIFRGPFYYYLIAPFYLLGKGNPVYPSVFLSFTAILASLGLYFLGMKAGGRTTGLIAAFISSLSYNIVYASRWLSNPTPMLLLSVLLIWLMIAVSEGNKKAWMGISLIAGLSLFHFGSSGEAFYFPAIALFAIWQRKNLPDKRTLIISIGLFLITVLPLIAFDIKNKGLILGNIQKFLFADKSFSLPTARFAGDKFEFYYDVFTNKIFNARYHLEKFVLWGVLLFFVYKLHNLIKNNAVKILLLLLGSVIVGLIFFQGNFGNIYDYYLTGYYLPFILLFSIALGEMWKHPLGKLFVAYFIYLFIVNNADVLKFKYTDGGLGERSVSFIAQRKSIEWIYKDAGNEKFNVDVYVPPVIPYAYDYLLKWKANPNVISDQTAVLYTLYEPDTSNPDRLEAWLARQKGIGKVEKTQRFGAITIERRTRF